MNLLGRRLQAVGRLAPRNGTGARAAKAMVTLWPATADTFE
jgi:hypothetical protein